MLGLRAVAHVIPRQVSQTTNTATARTSAAIARLSVTSAARFMRLRSHPPGRKGDRETDRTGGPRVNQGGSVRAGCLTSRRASASPPARSAVLPGRGVEYLARAVVLQDAVAVMIERGLDHLATYIAARHATRAECDQLRPGLRHRVLETVAPHRAPPFPFLTASCQLPFVPGRLRVVSRQHHNEPLSVV